MEGKKNHNENEIPSSLSAAHQNAKCSSFIKMQQVVHPILHVFILKIRF